MAASPLLVRLRPAPDPSEKTMRKVHSYFQSGKRSGGGECEVRTGSEPGTYWVQFQNEQDKKNVESRTDHILEVGGRRLNIVIQPVEGSLSQSPFTEQGDPSHSIPSSSFSPRQEQQAASGHEDTAREVISKKIFLTVSATLNTSMFSEEEREKITILCPNLKREGNPGIDGWEKLTGDFPDIEKAYHYFQDILAGNDPHHDFSQSESKNSLKAENDLDTEEVNELRVPSVLYEYFSYVCPQKIKEVCKRYGVCIRSKDESENTLLCFTSDKSPASVPKAMDFFTRTFQQSILNLKQEKIPVADSHTITDTIRKLNARFSHLLVKEEGNCLLLRGPESELSDAKKFLANQAEKNIKMSSELYQYKNGIEVDSSAFKLLETILSKEIEVIKDNFDTVIEKRESSCGQKMLIVFRPRIKTNDMSSHATESFINAFQSASAMLRSKLPSSRVSEDQNKRLNVLLNGKQLEGLHGKLKKEGKFILSGLPDHLKAAEKDTMDVLTTEDSTQTEKRTPLSSYPSYQEATGVSETNYSDRQKNNLSSEGQAEAKTEDDKCPICMDRINNKEILSKCKHAFCKSCVEKAMSYKKTCPLCQTVYGLVEGNQPKGSMSSTTIPASLPGYPYYGTIVITYVMQGGIQTINHPNPGKPYSGTRRIAYLPDNTEGREILQLLRRAFNQKLIFTVGQSCTTGEQNVITWNDIHHKTSTTGGPSKFGYPDPHYLQRVRSELKAKGIE
ncbi:E3 ubiquitin-protein ligase DTX3L [Melanerpes formicivorus]|uniref:E3 ubiquitin-protein ligase DTX3L n=1 Tax=Melanerpes formicivorus TaxID=211600 RepID=UPI00358EB663